MATNGNPLTDHLDLWTSALFTKSTAGRGGKGKPEAYGIKKLRELILELAVRGKLVPQDSNDEPAAELLRKIEDEKRRLIDIGELREKEVAKPISPKDCPFDVPLGWKWVRLSVITRRIHYGFTASAKLEIQNVRLLRITDIQDNTVNWSTVPGCEIEESDLPQYQLGLGDILVARTGGTVGKTYLVDEIPVAAVFASYLIRLQGASPLYVRYLKLFLESPTYWEQLVEGARGGAQPNVNGQTLGRMVVPLPPLAEQHRIVAKVDELMALCDRLEQQQADSQEAHQTLVESLLGTLTQIPASAKPVEARPSTSSGRTEFEEAWILIADHFDTLFTTEHSIDQLKQTILQLAVMGKLVPQDPNDEPASVILETAATGVEKTQNKVRDQRPGAQPESHSRDLQFEVPFSWKWALISDICSVQGGIQKQPMRTPKANYYPYLRVANVQRGYLDLTEISHFELYDGELEKWSLKRGDILVVEGNGSEEEIGRCAIWDGTIDNCVYQNHLIRIRTYLPKLETYIARFLNSQSGIEEMKRLAVTTSGLYNLSVGKIRSISVPIPPLAEQHRIVAKVDELMGLCESLKARLKAAQATQVNLADAIVELAAA